MSASTHDPEGTVRRWFLAAAALVCMAAAGAVAAVVVSGSVASAQVGELEPPPRLVILARSDNPADALASGPVGGAFGAPVLLTPPTELHPATAAALEARQPDLVVLAGGTAALSAGVEQAVADLGFATQRAAGADRHETAVLVAALLSEWQLPTDAVAGLEERVAALEATFEGVSRASDMIRFDGVNLLVTNGTGSTDGTPNGLGNVIIGYNAVDTGGPLPARNGSHYLIVGDEHEWTSFGGIVAGRRNTAMGQWASVTGGRDNTASGQDAAVSGGGSNTASGPMSSVSGGFLNTASGSRASVLGGNGNTAGGLDQCHPGC